MSPNSPMYGQVTALLATVNARRRALDRAQNIYGERLSPNFGVFQFIDTSEEGVSRLLAWLLDPHGDHAQGGRFLNEFMKWLGIDWDQEIRRTYVQTEAPVPAFGSTRFIDVLITTPTHALAIENKLGAPDQPNQVRDYLRFLRTTRPNYHILYLTPEGTPPNEKSIREDDAEIARASGVLHERSYESLIKFLEDCSRLARSQRVVYFIEDFTRHVGSSILGIENMEESAELALEIAEDASKLAAALEIFESEGSLKSHIMSKAQSQIKDQCASQNWVIEGDLTSGESGDYLLVRFAPDDIWGFGISFYHPNFRTMFYGLARHDGCDLRRRASLKLLSLLNDVQKGRGDDDWPWWAKAKPHNYYFPYAEDWAGTKDFWIAVNEGVFADRFFGFVSGMRKHLSSAKLLSLLR